MKKIKYLSIAVFALLVGLISNGVMADDSASMTKGVIVGD